MDAEQLIRDKLKELARRSDQRQQYTFTDFLGMMELNILYEISGDLVPVSYGLYGGMDGCERLMARFGSESELGYSQDFPINCVRIAPAAKKFAEPLNHRDFLGALMNLGIVRGKLGDIMIYDNTGYVFCTEDMTEYILSSLTRIRHTDVRCEACSTLPEYVVPKWRAMSIQAASERVDAVIAKVYGLTRNASLELFAGKRVFINGRLLENNSYFLKEKDMVTVRKYGKFSYEGYSSLSKKGKKNIVVKVPEVL